MSGYSGAQFGNRNAVCCAFRLSASSSAPSFCRARAYDLSHAEAIFARALPLPIHNGMLVYESLFCQTLSAPQLP
jgi:hypothetical protein